MTRCHPGYVVDRLRDPDDDLPSAALTYAIGRHTGVATFMPIVPALGRGGRGRRVATPTVADGASRATALVGGGGRASAWSPYVALYLVAFTSNYFGGGQSVGNRYFLQVSLLVPVVAVTVGVTSAVARWCTAAAAAWAVVGLGAQLRHPEEAFYRIDRTTAAQRLLPFDGSQDARLAVPSASPPPASPRRSSRSATADGPRRRASRRARPRACSRWPPSPPPTSGCSSRGA